MKLFAIYIGGGMNGANIELHDMRFIVAERIEHTYAELKRQWWGRPSSLHVDCWAEITRADGYQVSLKREPATQKLSLYYVNVGGYDANEFTEQHKNIFAVAESEGEAKTRALLQVKHWKALHKDNLYESEQIMRLGGQKGWFVHLKKIDDTSPSPFICKYQPIGSLK